MDGTCYTESTVYQAEFKDENNEKNIHWLDRGIFKKGDVIILIQLGYKAIDTPLSWLMGLAVEWKVWKNPSNPVDDPKNVKQGRNRGNCCKLWQEVKLNTDRHHDGSELWN